MVAVRTGEDALVALGDATAVALGDTARSALPWGQRVGTAPPPVLVRADHPEGTFQVTSP